MQTPCPQPLWPTPGFHGDVGEGAVAIVLEQVRVRFFAFGEAFQPPAVHQKDVEPAVVVVVVEGDAAAGGLEQVLVLVLAAEDGLGVETSFAGDVGEGDADIGARILREPAVAVGLTGRRAAGPAKARRRKSAPARNGKATARMFGVTVTKGIRLLAPVLGVRLIVRQRSDFASRGRPVRPAGGPRPLMR